LQAQLEAKLCYYSTQDVEVSNYPISGRRINGIDVFMGRRRGGGRRCGEKQTKHVGKSTESKETIGEMIKGHRIHQTNSIDAPAGVVDKGNMSTVAGTVEVPVKITTEAANAEIRATQ
jgi:hypothetical protein